MKKHPVFCLALIACLSNLAACDSQTDKLYADCMVCEDSLILDFATDKMYAGGHQTNFSTEMSAVEMKRQIDNMTVEGGDITATVYGNYVFLEKKTADGKTHYYLIDPIVGTDTSYNFSAPCNSFRGETILIPFHLLEMKHMNAGELDYIMEKIPYKLLYDKTELLAFYENLGIYNIEDGGEIIRVSLKEDVSVIKKSGYHTRCNFLISFEEKNGEASVSWALEDTLQ